MSKHSPHKQLKAIRRALHITQERAAELLGISYPYFLSVETGQRDLSRPLSHKISKTFGVTDIEDKNAQPLIRDPKSKAQLEFTAKRYLEYCQGRPSFFIEDSERIVTPDVGEYARCAHALLHAAEEQHRLRPVLVDFFNWFRQSNDSDRMLENLRRSFDRLFPGERRRSDALTALTADWEARAFYGKETDTKRRAAERKRKKRPPKKR